MTNYKIEITGEVVSLPKWVQNLPISEEASAHISREGYLTFELRGSYNRIEELLEQMVRIYDEDMPADVELLLEDRYCTFEKWYQYDRLRDYLGIYEEVEQILQERGNAE